MPTPGFWASGLHNCGAQLVWFPAPDFGVIFSSSCRRLCSVWLGQRQGWSHGDADPLVGKVLLLDSVKPLMRSKALGPPRPVQGP